jgi:surfactin synthase thioesterase subunit
VRTFAGDHFYLIANQADLVADITAEIAVPARG